MPDREAFFYCVLPKNGFDLPYLPTLISPTDPALKRTRQDKTYAYEFLVLLNYLICLGLLVKDLDVPPYSVSLYLSMQL